MAGHRHSGMTQTFPHETARPRLLHRGDDTALWLVPGLDPSQDRIRKQADFDRIYQARIYAADDVLVVNGDANGLTHSRLGLSVSRNCAVERARCADRRFEANEAALPHIVRLCAQLDGVALAMQATQP